MWVCDGVDVPFECIFGWMQRGDIRGNMILRGMVVLIVWLIRFVIVVYVSLVFEGGLTLGVDSGE